MARSNTVLEAFFISFDPGGFEAARFKRTFHRTNQEYWGQEGFSVYCCRIGIAINQSLYVERGSMVCTVERYGMVG
eukprot:scaffold26980_cov130-Amphora_coffeaeformis.AAC.1